MPIDAAEQWEIANSAFNLFTLQERKECLLVFASLRYLSLEDRFSEAVYRVISKDHKSKVAPATADTEQA
jgi:hypothetical protein